MSEARKHRSTEAARGNISTGQQSSAETAHSKTRTAAVAAVAAAAQKQQHSNTSTSAQQGQETGDKSKRLGVRSGHSGIVLVEGGNDAMFTWIPGI